MRLFTVAFFYFASLQVLEFRHVGNEIHTATTPLQRTRRSMTVIQCCTSQYSSQTCWPARKRPRAIATITNGGVEIECPDCPANWRSNLNWEGYGGPGIRVFCPGCPMNWRENLDISTSPKSLFISTKHPSNSTKLGTTTKPATGETDATDSTDGNSSSTTKKHDSTNSTKTSHHSNDTLTTNSNVTAITTISVNVTGISTSSTTTKPR